MSMRIGLSVTTHHPNVSGRIAAQRVINRTRAAATAELDHLTLGDKHSVGNGASNSPNVYLQNVPLLGRLLAEWGPDRPAGLLFLLPLWHPVLMAEQIGTLASLTDAPFIVQTGVGGGARQFEGMGAALSTRGQRTESTIRAVQALCAGESVSLPDQGIVEASVAPRPEQPVSWWIGAGDVEVGLDRAARLGDALYLSPHWNWTDVERLGSAYRKRCQVHGTNSRIVVRRDVFVADNDKAAVRRADELATAGYRGMGRGVLVAGDPGRVADLLAPAIEHQVDDIVARTMAVAADDAVRSVELLGEIRRRLQ